MVYVSAGVGKYGSVDSFGRIYLSGKLPYLERDSWVGKALISASNYLLIVVDS